MPGHDDPLDPSFWDDFDELLWAELGSVVLESIAAGAEGGAATLPAGAEVLIDWDGFNRAVADFARGYRFDLIRGLTDTTREQTQRAISDWIASGEPLDVLESRLAAIYGPERAERIAITETTRLFAQGNEMAWQSTGLVQKAIWRTVNDERVCPICEPRDGIEIELGDGPPAHVGCRCFEVPMMDEALLEERLAEILA